MNPKIKELAEQSGSTHKQSLGVYQFYPDELEAFAKLIIQECVVIVFDSDPSPKKITHEPYRTILNNIVEHFGIE